MKGDTWSLNPESYIYIYPYMYIWIVKQDTRISAYSSYGGYEEVRRLPHQESRFCRFCATPTGFRFRIRVQCLGLGFRVQVGLGLHSVILVSCTRLRGGGWGPNLPNTPGSPNS